MKRSRLSTSIILGILFLSAVVFIGSCRKAGLWLVKEDPTDRADAIVMLMGSISDRVLQVADLYEQKVSGKVIIARESMGADRRLEERGVRIISTSIQVNNALVKLGIPGDSILILPGAAVSTQMEAVIVRDFLANRPDIGSVLLVSSAPHMRRASMIFSAAFKPLEHPVEILCSPSSYTSFDAEKWWRHKEDIQHVVMEYLKIGSFILIERKNLRD